VQDKLKLSSGQMASLSELCLENKSNLQSLTVDRSQAIIGMHEVTPLAAPPPPTLISFLDSTQLDDCMHQYIGCLLEMSLRSAMKKKRCKGKWRQGRLILSHVVNV
jgi:hypothetical protein